MDSITAVSTLHLASLLKGEEFYALESRGRSVVTLTPIYRGKGL